MQNFYETQDFRAIAKYKKQISSKDKIFFNKLTDLLDMKLLKL